LWLAALLFYLPIRINHDLSRYLIAADRMFDGERASRDIINTRFWPVEHS
jgi:hypothetical protein